MTIKNVTIFGERCTGTNYLHILIKMNFVTKITWKYGYKHWFRPCEGCTSLKKSDDTLFICIVRGIVPWMNSFFRTPHHWHGTPGPPRVPSSQRCKRIDNMRPAQRIQEIRNFINKEFWSYRQSGSNPTRRPEHELMRDRNIYTGKRYKHLFELRHTKHRWLIEDLPNKVTNYILIKYEDLINKFKKTMTRIRNKGLDVKPDIKFPLNTDKYIRPGGGPDESKPTYSEIKWKPGAGLPVACRKQFISAETILNNPRMENKYEKLLGYM